jgi:capsular exopolysaccharide synthesis family protein
LGPEETHLDLRQLLGVLGRRRWVVAGSVLAIVGAVGIWTWLQTPIYEATALLLVETRRPQLRAGVEELPILGAALDIARARSVETHKRLVKSRPVLDEVLRSVAPDASLHDLVGKVDVEAFRDTDLLEIKVQDPDPPQAADIANAIAVHYVQESQTYSREAARSARDFLEGQIEHVRGELRTAEDALQQFKRERSIADLSAETRAVIERVAEMEAHRADAEADVRAAEAQAASTRGELAKHEEVQEFSRTIQKNPVIEALEQRLVELEIERAGVLEDYTEDSPEVAAVDARLERARQELATQVSTILASSQEQVSPVYQTLLISGVQEEAQAKGARQRGTSLAGAIRRLSARLNDLPAKEAQLARLTRAQKVADTVYTLLLEKMHEVRLAESMQLSNARIWETAATPETPVRPRKRLNMALAIGFGLLLGLLLAAVIEYLDDTIKDPDEAKRALQTPVMGIVPLVRDEDKRLLTEVSGRSAMAEAYRLIRSNISFASVDKPVKTLLVTSPREREGKSTTALNLGIIMAQQENRVLVVDTDLRRPTLHRMLATDNKRGLTNVLVGEASLADVVRDTDVESLQFIAAGPIPPNPAELLGSERVQSVISELRDLADVVIFDSPPVAMVADASILGAQVDGTLLVLEQKGTRRPVAVAGRERLDAARAALLGTVLNKAAAAPGEYYYHYYYYDRYYGGDDEGETAA